VQVSLVCKLAKCVKVLSQKLYYLTFHTFSTSVVFCRSMNSVYPVVICLELFICKWIFKNHRGCFRVESKKNVETALFLKGIKKQSHWSFNCLTDNKTRNGTLIVIFVNLVMGLLFVLSFLLLVCNWNIIFLNRLDCAHCMMQVQNWNVLSLETWKN